MDFQALFFLHVDNILQLCDSLFNGGNLLLFISTAQLIIATAVNRLLKTFQRAYVKLPTLGFIKFPLSAAFHS